MGGFDIRAGRADDIEGVLEVIQSAMASYTAWLPEFTPPADLTERERERWLSDGKDVHRLVASVDRAPAGVAIWRSGNPATLSLLMVCPRSWGQGIGRALLERITSEAAASGASEMRLTVPERNARARALYEASGWVQGSEASSVHPWLGLAMVEYRRAEDHN